MGPHLLCPYDEQQRALLRRALHEGADMTERHQRSPIVREAEAMFTAAHVRAVRLLCQHNQIALTDIDVIGFHGQTIVHRPAAGLTVQIGDVAALHRELKRPIVYDFRAADVIAGGQGAPLVPIYHHALIADMRRRGVSSGVNSAIVLPPIIAVLNIGGVSNVTVVSADGAVLASDVGPGNALIDDFMLARRGQAFDKDGALAAQGRIAADVLAYWLAHPFFGLPAPKSLDRNEFSTQHSAQLSDADGAATLTAFTAEAIALFAKTMPAPADLWIVCGGGAHNQSMLKMVRAALNVPVITADDLNWPVDALEAQAFAYLAVRSLLNLPISFPTTTGVPVPMSGGVLYQGEG
jgi:anhydro-N-acetylmuramic acid kinase